MVGYKKSYTTRYKQADERQFRLIWFWQPAILTTADQGSMTSAVEFCKAMSIAILKSDNLQYNTKRLMVQVLFW